MILYNTPTLKSCKVKTKHIIITFFLLNVVEKSISIKKRMARPDNALN